ncbi:hypothetical protein Tsubulata_049573, partial [Turnera subulata]
EVLLYANDRPRNRVEADKIFKFLYGIRNVESLVLSTIAFEAMNRAGSLKHQTSSLSKLRSLKLFVGEIERGWESFEGENTDELKLPEEITTYLLSGTPHPQNVDIILDHYLIDPVDDHLVDDFF